MTENAVTEDKFYSPENVAEYLDISLEKVRRAYQRGELRSTRIGRLVRMRRSWVDAWAEGQTRERTAA